MSYYAGTASSLSDLRTALLTHAQSDGWTLTGNVLSKAGVYFDIQADSSNLKCLGVESNAGANPAPCAVMIGKIYELAGHPTRLISFPCTYEVFGFSQELYLIVNYDVDSYQWMAFGKTTVPGIPGQGGWCGATLGGAVSNYSSGSNYDPIVLYMASASNIDPASQYAGATCAALFWSKYPIDAYPYAARNSFVNSGLDGDGWQMQGTPKLGHVSMHAMSELLWMQPSAWNSEATLLPVRAWKPRPNYKISMTVDLQNARHLRIDNLAPGDILTLGSDKWKVFPWYRKSAAQRNGGYAINHTGTFGWAIRYQGP